MFMGCPFHSEEERRQEGIVHQGMFVREGDGHRFRWVSGGMSRGHRPVWYEQLIRGGLMSLF